MTYEQRTDLIGAWLRDVVLPRYSRPDHLDNAQARAEVGDMVNDINAEIPLMPADDFPSFLSAAFSKLRRTYTGRSWPAIGVICKAMSGARKDAPTGKPAEYKADDYAIAEARIRSGQSIGQDYIYGPKAKELEARGVDLTAYRSGLFFNLREVYGEERAKQIEARYRAEHDASVRPTSEAELYEMRANARLKKMDQVNP